MYQFPDYIIDETIYESKNSILFRVHERSTKAPRIIKLLNSEHPSQEQLSRFQLEFEMTDGLRGDGIIEVHDLIKFNNTLAIVLNDLGAQSLKEMFRHQRPEESEFLQLALKITEALGQVHSQKVIHKDLNPANIIYNRKSGVLKLIDFGISTLLPRETPSIRSPGLLEGTLAYISPEQTGRMNRALDYRTDFYSLGACFYELLTGTLPFQHSDPLDMIHAHIAEKAKPPHEIDSNISETLSRIVMKLLSKTAEERYQSATGLRNDLLRLQAGEAEFEPGLNDVSEGFQLPQKLYGRANEISLLMNSFERAAAGGRELALVSGFAGIGKSALIQEIHKPILRSRGFFISGKFEQYRRNIPYASLIQASQELVRQILSAPPDGIERRKTILLEKLGPNARLILDVVPELEFIIGPQLQISPLPAAESRNRFNLTFINFIRSLADSKNPLALFMDDLQWADSSSLELIKMLMIDPEIRYFMIICSYRDNEPVLENYLNEISTLPLDPLELHLGPLALESVATLIKDTLGCDEKSALALAGIVATKTQGNPLFVNQFLTGLYEAGLLEFNPAQGKWSWDKELIKNAPGTENIVELMGERIARLNSSEQETLRIAACLGARFDLETLSLVSDETPAQTASKIFILVSSGMLYSLNDFGFSRTEMDYIDKHPSESAALQFRFLHDRLQQAAYSNIPPAETRALHSKIARLLLKKSSNSKTENRVFEIAGHFNQGEMLLENKEEIRLVAQLNYRAGVQARASASFGPALTYLQEAIILFERSDGNHEEEHDFVVQLYSAAAEAAYLCSNFKQMDRYIKRVMGISRGLLERVPMHELKIQYHFSRNNPQESISEALRIAADLGFSFPARPGVFHILRDWLRTGSGLLFRKKENLETMPDAVDERIIAVSRIIDHIGHSAYRTRPALLPLLVFQGVRNALKYGSGPASGFSFAAYGMFLCGGPGRMQEGFEFGELGLKLSERASQRKSRARAWFMMAAMIRHWKFHMRESLPLLQAAYREGLETGDFEFGTLSIHMYGIHSIFSGKPLQATVAEIRKNLKHIKRLNQETNYNYISLMLQANANLLEGPDSPWILEGEHYSESKMLAQHLEVQDQTAVHALYFHKAMLNYLFGNYSGALVYADLMMEDLDTVLGLVFTPLSVYYDSLIRLAVARESSGRRRRKLLRAVKRNQKKMKHWAKHAPMNYECKWTLVEAERFRILGKIPRAMELYNQAITQASHNEFTQEVALAYELAGDYHLTLGRIKTGRLFLREARYLYKTWGSEAKVRDLDKRYLGGGSGQETSVFAGAEAPFSVVKQDPQALDLTAVLRASQALSSEIKLSDLLNKLCLLLLQNAGARKALLLLEEAGDYKIEADVEQESISGLPYAESGRLCPAIVNYTARTGEIVMEGDASREGRFTNDPYILQHRCRSILCMPVRNKGRISAILYLENNLTRSAFTPKHLEVLRVLTAQAAISIENARLYAGMEERVKARTKRLSLAIQTLREKNSVITDKNRLIEQRQQIADEDMRMAIHVQRSYFRPEPAISSNWETSLVFRPMMGVSGDMFDFFMQGDLLEGAALFDVSGHGVSSALITMLARPIIHRHFNKMRKQPLDEVLKSINQDITDEIADMENFLTGIVLRFHENQVEYVNAAHPGLLLRKADNGEVEMIETDNGHFLGVDIFDNKFNATRFQVDPGDMLMVYSDALEEGMNEEREQYGAKRVRQAFAALPRDIDCDSARLQLMENFYQFTRDPGALSDDLTVIFLRKK